MSRKKFKNVYFTIGVKNRLPLEIPFLIIRSLEYMEIEKDYLQVFKLEVLDENLLAIEHSQEEPKWSMTYYMDAGEVTYSKDLTGVKLYMVIEEERATLMLAEEY